VIIREKIAKALKFTLRKLFTGIKILNMNEYIVFEIKGGVGKNVIATAVIKALKKQYPESKILIVTAWDDLWYNNPNVYKVFKFGELKYFYDDYL
jgi:uncharacterized phage-like protein YoqJ